MKKARAYVSDHALLRYLERALGFDTEALRREIGHRVDRAAEAGACGVVIDGMRYALEPRLDGGVVVATVAPASELANRRRSRLRTGAIDEAEPEVCLVPGCGNAVPARKVSGLCQLHEGRGGRRAREGRP